MAYHIDFSKRATEELKQLRTFDQRRIIDEIETQLGHQPTTVTRNRKCLDTEFPGFEHVPPIWELRVGDYRVFYDVDEIARVVSVRAVRLKRPGQKTREIIDERDDN